MAGNRSFQLLVFSTFLAVRFLCANFSIIPDCDEVFNYYEPLHYLTNGFGLQTWEYSGEYAIRSWAYIWIHGVVIKLAQYAGVAPKWMLFYVLRYTFALFSAFAETRLFLAIARNISQRVAVWYFIISAVSTGMFHASISFLPSSFAMHFFTLSFAQFLNFRSVNRDCQVVEAVSLAAVGGLVGWPFSLLIISPLLAQYIIQTVVSHKIVALIKCGASSILISAGILAVVVAIDSQCYQKLAIVPYNIVSYNVLSASDEAGPEIFGTEPWTYYVSNLLLNFNIGFPLALLSLLAPVVRTIFVSQRHSSITFGEALTTISPFFVWFGVLIVQPHKEERFLYVGYPSLILNAALGLEIAIAIASKLATAINIKKSFSRFLAAVSIIVVYTSLSLSRSIALRDYYGGVLLLYQHIPENTTGNVCIGREWYRYPSSYFLHDDQRLKFIKSGFDGLLPGEFDEHDGPWWNRVGTSKIPANMNNKNLEDESKYVSIRECDYLIDTNAEVDAESGEQLYIDTEDWTRLVCSRFLNTGKSTGIGRILWLPEPLLELSGSQLEWDLYCLLQQV